jgi:hypothetical protein
LVEALYDSSITYTDAQLHRLQRRLEASEPDAGTVVVFTSDHGEMLGEGGYAGHCYLDEPNILVPLVVALPHGAGAGRTVTEQVRSVDIAPTILELAGLPIPEGIDGASLVPLLDDEDGTGRASRPAWIYAATTNWGASLRLDNEVKYTFNNTAWVPSHGHETFVRLDGRDGSSSDGDEGPASALSDKEVYRRRLAAVFDAGFSGLRIRFRNSGDTGFKGTLSGPMIRIRRVKSFDLPCPCATWEGVHRAGFTVPADESFSLLVEEVDGNALTVSLEGEAPQEFEVDLPALGEPVVLARLGGRWRVLEDAATDAPASITIEWQGNPRRGEEVRVEMDEALEEQLRALGYIQ